MEFDVLSGGLNKIIDSGYPPILFESIKDDPRAHFVINLLGKLGYKILMYAEMDCLAQHPNWESEIELKIENNYLEISKSR